MDDDYYQLKNSFQSMQFLKS